MSNLLDLISPIVLQNDDGTISNISSKSISDIFAPGENLFFTKKREQTETKLLATTSQIQGTPSLIESFNLDAKTSEKIKAMM